MGYDVQLGCAVAVALYVLEIVTLLAVILQYARYMYILKSLFDIIKAV